MVTSELGGDDDDDDDNDYYYKTDLPFRSDSYASRRRLPFIRSKRNDTTHAITEQLQLQRVIDLTDARSKHDIHAWTSIIRCTGGHVPIRF